MDGVSRGTSKLVRYVDDLDLVVDHIPFPVSYSQTPVPSRLGSPVRDPSDRNASQGVEMGHYRVRGSGPTPSTSHENEVTQSGCYRW